MCRHMRAKDEKMLLIIKTSEPLWNLGASGHVFKKQTPSLALKDISLPLEDETLSEQIHLRSQFSHLSVKDDECGVIPGGFNVHFYLCLENEWTGFSPHSQ